jgi:sugar lactone lactonase YvrE
MAFLQQRRDRRRRHDSGSRTPRAPRIGRWRDETGDEHRTDRLLRLDPGAAEAQVVDEGLAFANGVALAADRVSFLTVR